MKIKKNEDVSDLDIDKVLTEKYDLGFLLDQIKNKNIYKFLSLPIIDVLRFFPQFGESIKRIREELDINPETIREDLSKQIGIESFQNFALDSKSLVRGIFSVSTQLIDSYDYNEVTTKITDWKRKRFPLLPKKVASIRLKVFGKVPHAWQVAIEDYILFEKISAVPIIYRRPSAEIKAKVNNATSEPYIEVKIYADTDIESLPKISWWKKVQKLLPAYCDPREWDENMVITRFMQYVLRRHLKLTQKQTLEWIKKHNLIAPDYQHASQELRRFEELFMSTRRK